MTDPRSEALRALSTFLVADTPAGETLHRVAELATSEVPRAEVAGISLLDVDGSPTTAVYTDETSQRSTRPSTTRDVDPASTHGATARPS